MEFVFGGHKLKVWYIIVMAFYMYSIMLKSARWITYLYFYIIPFFYLLAHINQSFKFLWKLKCGYLSVFITMFLIVLVGSIATPIVNGSGDFSFLLQGPFKALIINFVINLFLLILYINFKKGKGNLIEFSLYYICANVLYVISTLIICAIPELHNFFATEIYMNPVAQEAVQLSFYYSRIGWSGFSNYIPSASCSIGVILCILNILKSNYKNNSNVKLYIAISLLLIGNLCYARTGVIASLLCLALHILFMIIKKKNVMIVLYTSIFVCLLVLVGVYLNNNNELVRLWFSWAFAQVNSYLETGDYRTASVDSLLSMYNKIPDWEVFLLGDGRYGSIEDGGFYMGVDIGWLRSLYYYGFFFSLIAYLALIPLLKKISKNLIGYVTSSDTKLMSLLFLLFFIIFESKGEICFYLYGVLLPFCLLDTNSKSKVALVKQK